MTPKELKGQNVVFGAGQEEYRPLPAIALENEEMTVITCWELSDEEIADIAKNRCLYISQLRFTRPAYDNGKFYLVPNPLQPILPSTKLEELI